MWRSKKFIIVAVLAVVLLAGSIGGVAMAADNGDNSKPAFTALWDKVATILQGKGIDVTSEQLKEAFTQARSEMRTEALQDGRMMDSEAMQERLQNLYEEGKITEEQYLKMKERMESMPDNLPGFGFRGHGGFRGFGGMRGFGGPCAPAD